MGEFTRVEALDAARALQAGKSDDAILSLAARLRDGAWGNVVTYSPKVFIPLTMACRDVCHYCTFARSPERSERIFMRIEEVLDVAVAGLDAGCKEVLFTLGDKPEARYPAARRELSDLGFGSTLEYLAFVSGAVLEKTGLLPHLNPGLIGPADMAALRETAPSMGLMLESVSQTLMAKGGPHYGSPDKNPDLRLETIREAGRQKIPFTTGILIGIGETWSDRAEALLAIEQINQEQGHIQEVIVQNFRAKPGTIMHNAPEPDEQEMLQTIALARLILGPSISLQAPPNLANHNSCGNYLDAGINDWGGVSPLTKDYVNPEAPWPALEELRSVTESKGFMLVPRLTVYQRFIEAPGWLSKPVRPRVLELADSAGLARDESWYAGRDEPVPDVFRFPTSWTGEATVGLRPAFAEVLNKAAELTELNEDDITMLFSARGPEQAKLFSAADQLRREVNGDTVTFVVNRNINYTNMCYFKCGFCAFSKGPRSLNLKGDPYLLDLEEIAGRVAVAAERGATEVCLQGGIHPSFTGDFYVDVVAAIKAVVPDIHIHAFSPLEVWQGAATKGVSVRDFLWELKDEGLNTLPGTAAEILDDDVRAVICPDKISTSQWSEVAMQAHMLGLRMTTTIMFGHCEGYRSWARHLIVLRDIQKQTGGFTEFVPLPFVHMGAPIFLRGAARKGPTFEETLKMHSVARLALHPWIPNIQASWVKMGKDGAQKALLAGCNDLGGTLMNESISRAAGASHGQEVTPEEMKVLTNEIGRPWAQRNTLYGIVEMGTCSI